MNNPRIAKVRIQRRVGEETLEADDALAVEEPMEIRLAFTNAGKRVTRSLSITMRTPGEDFDLAAGFLFTESIVQAPEQIVSMSHFSPPIGDNQLRNVVRVDLAPDVQIDFERLERHFYTSSSCGVCGKSSLEALAVGQSIEPIRDNVTAPAETIHRLSGKLREAQAVFDQTGGLHAAALFDENASLLSLREDVGRHNALDKLIGAEFLANRIPVSNRILFLSGRASFELIQKALVARIPIVAAVGAPSSLAVGLAFQYGMTLMGFVRENRFNVYTGQQRII